MSINWDYLTATKFLRYKEQISNVSITVSNIYNGEMGNFFPAHWSLTKYLLAIIFVLVLHSVLVVWLYRANPHIRPYGNLLFFIKINLPQIHWMNFRKSFQFHVFLESNKILKSFRECSHRNSNFQMLKNSSGIEA